MNYVGIIFRMLRMLVCSFLSFGKLKIKVPLRMGNGASITRRGTGCVELGKHVSLNNNARLGVVDGAVITVGEYSGFGDNCVVVARERITIGSNVMVGPNVCIYDHDHAFRGEGVMREQGFTTSPVVIEDNVWIGAGVIILKGVTIGSGSVIGAGTIVTRNIPADSVAYNKKELCIKTRLK